MRRILLSLALLALPLGACGTAGGRGGFSSFLQGPAHLALPLFLDGSIKTLVLRNLVDVPAQVTVTTIPGAVTTTVDVPARGETRRPATSFLPAGARWLLVDTTNPGTTGFVEPYLRTERSGPDVEALYAALLQRTESVIPVHPQTDVVSLLNFHPAAVMYDVRYFGANDLPTAPTSLVQVLVAANSFTDLAPLFGPGNVGHISVTPTAPTAYAAGEGFTLAAHQDPGLVVEVDDRDEDRNGVSRLLEPTGTPSAELMMEFGRDPVTGGYEDFDVLVSNVTDTTSSLTVLSIYDEFGNPVKTTPMTFQVPARQSRLFATTLVDTLGLQVGEIHPFAHAFGDVFLAADRRLFRMNLSIGRELFVSGRVFDPVALEFVGGLRPSAVRRSTSVLMSELQTTLAGGIANFADLSNPSANPITVQVRAFTIQNGTEYLLGSFVIPPRGITRFRGDALHLKEEPGNPIQSDVPHLRFLFSSNATFGTRGRGEGRDGTGLLIFVTPHILRHEE
jgi:hypothetical protein